MEVHPWMNQALGWLKSVSTMKYQIVPLGYYSLLQMSIANDISNYVDWYLVAYDDSGNYSS